MVPVSYRCFQALQRRRDGFTFDIAASQTNYYRNRYKDVLPYDQTRVILRNFVGDSDYINANFINVSDNSKKIFVFVFF